MKLLGRFETLSPLALKEQEEMYEEEITNLRKLVTNPLYRAENSPEMLEVFLARLEEYELSLEEIRRRRG